MPAIVRWLTKEEVEPVWNDLVKAATKKLEEQPWTFERFKAAQEELDQLFCETMVELYPGYRVLVDVRRDWGRASISVLLCTE